MLYLDSPTRKIEIVLAGAVSANAWEITSHYFDHAPQATTTLRRGGMQRATSNNTTDVTIVSAPAAQQGIRNVHTISIHNKDTATGTVTVKYDDSGTETIIVRQALQAGDSLTYEDGAGWVVLTPITAPFVDTTLLVKGSSDATKFLRIEVDGISTSTTRVWTVADADIKVAGHATGFTSGRVPYATGSTGGVLTDSANLTFDGTTLTAAAITSSGTITFSSLTANRVVYTTTGGALAIDGDLTYDGTTLVANTVDINGGAIDGTTVGSTVRAAGAFTTLGANSTVTFSAGGSMTGTWSDLGAVTTVDINGGTIDGAVIGGASAAAGTFTTLGATGDLTVARSGAGGYVLSISQNTETANAASHAGFRAIVGGASAGDPKLQLTVSGVMDWTMGADNSDSDTLKWGSNQDVGTSTLMSLTTGGALAITGGFSATTGNFTGNVTLGNEASDSHTVNGVLTITGASTNLAVNSTGDPAIFSRYAAGTNSPVVFFQKSRSGTIGAHTVVQDGDELGGLLFRGSDGSNFISGAMLRVIVDGTPGTNDMPAAIIFSTTADGASSATDRWKLTRDGHWLALTDNSFDIGATGATRARRIFLGDLVAGGAATHRGWIVLEGAGNAVGTANGGIEFKNSPSSNGYGWRLQNPDLGAGDIPLVLLRRSDSATWTEHMRFNANGSTAIGGELSLGSATSIYRSVDNSLLVVNGGNGSNTGAHIELFGGTHATDANKAYYDAAQHALRSQDGGTTEVTIVPGSSTTIASNLIIGSTNGIYRSINNGLLHISGGNAAGTGYNIELLGGAHATNANEGFFDGAAHHFRSQNGATTTFYVAPGTGVTISHALSYGGVTLNNAVTGTGNMVLSASPTLSGTVGGALTFSGSLTLSSALTYGGVTLSNAVTGTGNMVLSTNAALTTPAFTGNPTGTVTSGTYTPTATAVANLDSVTFSSAQYMRVGNTVTVSGSADVDASVNTTATAVRITLPVSSNFAATSDCAGCGTRLTGVPPMAISADTTNDQALFEWVSNGISSQTFSYTFTYRVI